MQTHLTVESLSNVCYSPQLICHYVLLIKIFEILLGWIHFNKIGCSLNKSDKHYLAVQPWVHFHHEFHLSQVAIFTFSESISFLLNDSCFCRSEVPQD